VNASGKALDTLLKKAPADKPKLFFSHNNADKINCLCSVPPSLTSTLKANEWVSECKKVFQDFKGGGKEQSAQGQMGPFSEGKLKEVVGICRAFVEGKLGK